MKSNIGLLNGPEGGNKIATEGGNELQYQIPRAKPEGWGIAIIATQGSNFLPPEGPLSKAIVWMLLHNKNEAWTMKGGNFTHKSIAALGMQ